MPGMMWEDTELPDHQAARPVRGSHPPPSTAGCEDLMDIDAIVAAAVGLAEGEAGVRDILAAVLSAEPVPVREISRLAELPVPIVAAACNELRSRGVLERTRPVALTGAGRAAVAAGQPDLDP